MTLKTLFTNPQADIGSGDAVIQNGQTVSSSVSCPSTPPVGIIPGAGFPIGPATFEISLDGTNFFPLMDGVTGNSIGIIVTDVNSFYRLLPVDFIGAVELRIVASSPVGSDVKVIFALRNI